MAEVINQDHEAGDWSEYDIAPAGANLVTISASAGLNGSTYGILYDCSKSADSAEVDIGTGLADAATIIRLGWRMDLNTLDVTGGDAVIFDAMNTIGTSLYASIRITDNGGNPVLEIENNEDGAMSSVMQSGTLPASECTIEVVWEKPTSTSSNDGVCTIYINKGQSGQDATLDNTSPFEDTTQTAANLVVGGVEGATGIMYYDDIIVRDDSTSIFVFSGYDLVAGGGQP